MLKKSIAVVMVFVMAFVMAGCKEVNEKSKDAELKELIITMGNGEKVSLLPEFSKDIFAYSSEVESSITAVAIKAVPASNKAKIDISGKTELITGENTFIITVTEEDEKYKNSYIVIINRKEAVSNNALLKSIDLKSSKGNINIVPLFSKDVTSYSAIVENNITTTEVIGVCDYPKATVTGNGMYVLKEGANIVKVKVTAENKQDIKEYTININRKVNSTGTDFDAKTDLKINVELKDGWTDVNMWYDKDADGSWETTVLGAPETKMTPDIQKPGWYYRIFKNTSAIKFLFNKGSWDDKITNQDGSDFSYDGGPGEIWITKNGEMKTPADLKTIIYFEKPSLWAGAGIKYKINDAEEFTLEQMSLYRTGWYTYELKKEYKKFEFIFIDGSSKVDNNGVNYVITAPEITWITKDGKRYNKDPFTPENEGIRFNSRDTKYKSPFGAVPAGTNVEFMFETNVGIADEANLIIEKQNLVGDRSISYTKLDSIKMSKETLENKDMWKISYSFDSKGVYGYFFEIIKGGSKRYICGSAKRIAVAHYNLPLTGGDGAVFSGFPKEGEFIQTVYDKEFKTPEWAKDIVYYYIFPERFRNGNKDNDPKPGVDKFYGNKDVEIHKNWLDPKPWVPGDGSDSEWCNDFYGGDLAGIVEKLDYLKDLGVNTIYTNPIFEAPSNHKYDTADYMKIDNNFGSLEDFKTLVNEAKARGIRVILDISLNHSGSDSVYMDRYGKYNSNGAFENEKINTNSPYYDWFLWNPNAATADGKYNQWANPTLATLNPNSQSYRDFAFRNSDSVTKYWLKQGSAGWRMDVAPWKPDDFWREWRTAVKEQDSEALTVAECWFDSSKYFLGDTFDSTMNYIFRQAVYNFAGGKDAKEVNAMLELMRENYPMEAFYTLMNLLSTHDAPRALYNFGYTVQGGEGYSDAISKLKLAVLFQMTYPGAPAVYYGDEVGMTGGHDPFNRGPYPWEDAGGNPDKILLEEFKKLIKMRNDNSILRRGTLEPVYNDDNVIVMKRTFEGKTAFVALNNKSAEATVEISTGGLNGEFNDILNNGTITAVDSKIKLTIKPQWGIVLIK